MSEDDIFHVPATPEARDRDRLLGLVEAWEASVAGPLDSTPLAILIRDAAGETIGGLWGNSLFRWLVVESVFIPPAMRGRDVGRALMARAEAIARARGCIGIWLDTYSFQARGFYEKLGFEVCGQIDDHPPGAVRYILRKRFSAEPGPAP